MRLLYLFFAGLFVCGSSVLAEAQTVWPQRSVSLVTAVPDQTPWGVENPEAALLKELSSQLGRELGVPVSLTQETAGQGLMAANMVAGARPDGYLFGALSAEAAMIRIIQGLTPYTWKEFQPVSVGWSQMYALVALDKLPYNTLEEVAAGTAAGRVRLAHSGLEPAGADTVLALKAAWEKGFTWKMVEFKNFNPDILLTGEAEVMVWPLSTLFKHPDAEYLKVIALLSPDREKASENNGSFAASFRSAPFEPSLNFYFPAQTSRQSAETLAASLNHILSEPWIMNFMKDNHLSPRPVSFPWTAEAWEADYENQEILLRQLGLI